MKRILYIFTLLIACVFAEGVFAQEQDGLVAGANAAFYVPVGTLASRYKPVMGGSFYLGKGVSESWTWTGKLEYFKYDELNTDKLFLTRALVTNGPQYKIPLSKLKMSLEAGGLSANAAYHVYKNDFVKADIEIGFGIYRWTHKRSDYIDSVYVDTTGRGDNVLEEYLNVPGKTEQDWNGGLTFGLGVDVNIYKWASFYASANYKLIIGELWPALSLDMENVSGMQMIEIKAGLRARF